MKKSALIIICLFTLSFADNAYISPIKNFLVQRGVRLSVLDNGLDMCYRDNKQTFMTNMLNSDVDTVTITLMEMRIKCVKYISNNNVISMLENSRLKNGDEKMVIRYIDYYLSVLLSRDIANRNKYGK